MNESSDLELPFHEDNIQIEDNKHNLKIRSICTCIFCISLIIFTNYISFCIGIIYFQQDGSSSNKFII